VSTIPLHLVMIRLRWCLLLAYFEHLVANAIQQKTLQLCVVCISRWISFLKSDFVCLLLSKMAAISLGTTRWLLYSGSRLMLITLGQMETDNNSQMITIANYFHIPLYSKWDFWNPDDNKRLITVTMITLPKRLPLYINVWCRFCSFILF